MNIPINFTSNIQKKLPSGSFFVAKDVNKNFTKIISTHHLTVLIKVI